MMDKGSIDKNTIKESYIQIKETRPNMFYIEEDIRVFGRPSANKSKEMKDYIYKLENYIEKYIINNI